MFRDKQNEQYIDYTGVKAKRYNPCKCNRIMYDGGSHFEMFKNEKKTRV